MEEINEIPACGQPKSDTVTPPPVSIKYRVPDWEELIRERTEYAKTKPEPALEEQLAEVRWFESHRYDPEIQAHRGDYVAIYNCQVVGTGTDRLTLELACAKRFGIHPARVLVEWIDDGRDLHIALLNGFVELPPSVANAQDSP